MDLSAGNDIDHYDRTGICGCGLEKKICTLCWRTFMDPAQLVLDYIYAYFGLTAKFRVFSGRRGFHDYLINKRVIHMTVTQRLAFYESINWRNWVPGTEMHDEIYGMLKELFAANKVLSARFVPPPGPVDSPAFKEAYRRLVFETLYPKIDKPVLLDPTHLHKLPLTLHPESGNLCVVMGPVNSRLRFEPNEDIVPPSHVRMEHILVGVKLIQRAVDILKEENKHIL